MKTSELIRLERQRADLVDEARSACDDFDWQKATDAELKAQDKKLAELHRSIDRVDLDIAEEQLRADDQSAREAHRPGSGESIVTGASGDSDHDWLSGPRSPWLDQRGNPVRVYRSGERSATHEEGSVSFGDLVRAKVAGPRSEAEKRALSEGTDSAGGFTVPAPLSSQFVDRLRARSVAVQAGAQYVPMDSATFTMARLETDPTTGWRAENATLATGDPTFGRVHFVAKSLAGYIRVSRELMFDSVNVGEMLETAFARSMAVELDRAAIYGDGTSNSPTGVWNTAGISTVDMGTNGAAITSYDKPLETLLALKNANAADPTAMICAPRTEIELATLKDSQNNPLRPPALIERIPLLSTTSAPIDETQGTAVDASSIVFGDFRDLLIGLREEISLSVFEAPHVTDGQFTVVAHMRADIQLARPASFARLVGIIPPA